jgi:cell division protein FtsB
MLNTGKLSTLHIQLFTFLHRSRRKIASVAVGLLITFMAYHVVFGANGIVVYQHKKAEYKRLDAELKSLEDENQRISEHIEALQTDPKAIEKEAREQLRYARPGEVIYVAPETRPADTHTAKK